MILVTGGTGLVGSHLLLDLVKAGKTRPGNLPYRRKLKAVKNVFSYTNSQAEAEHLISQIEWYKADITDVPSLKMHL